jgi:hypothetical protein
LEKHKNHSKRIQEFKFQISNFQTVDEIKRIGIAILTESSWEPANTTICRFNEFPERKPTPTPSPFGTKALGDSKDNLWPLGLSNRDRNFKDGANKAIEEDEQKDGLFVSKELQPADNNSIDTLIFFFYPSCSESDRAKSRFLKRESRGEEEKRGF